MARVLFLTWDGAGNQPPAAALAAALNRQGHTVVFAGNEHQRHYFAKRGFAFVLLRRAAGRWRQEAQECMFAVKREAVWACSEHIDDVPQLMAQENCGAVVIDCLMFGALAAAEKLRLPAAAFIHSAPGALMPPGGPFEAQLFAAVNQLREESGLSSLRSLWEAWAPFPAISNSIRALDPFASRAPRSFQYCGPMPEQEPARAKWTSFWPSADGRPLVLVSFSTGPYWDQSPRILKTLHALADGPYRVLVTAGQARIDPAMVSSNAVVVERAPHDDILPNAALTITHAGHGTVLASLSHGVPLLCLPNPVADQPILAQQVEALGCGLSLEDAVAPAAIKSAVERMLHDRSFEMKCLSLAKQIAETPGVSFAVSYLESALGLSGIN